jgi:hypothetical protein
LAHTMDVSVNQTALIICVWLNNLRQASSAFVLYLFRIGFSDKCTSGDIKELS